MPKRIPILYLIFGVLIAVSVGPLLWYSNTVVGDETGRLQTNEMLLQNTLTRSVGEELAQRQSSLLTMMGNLASAITVASGGELKGDQLHTPELRALLEKFVSTSDNIPYATLISSESKGITAGNIQLDDCMRRELEHVFAAASEGRYYTGPVLQIGPGKERHTWTLVS